MSDQRYGCCGNVKSSNAQKPGVWLSGILLRRRFGTEAVAGNEKKSQDNTEEQDLNSDSWRVKISIASDFRKNNSILAAAISAVDQAEQQKKWDFCAHATRQPRRNEWARRSFDEAPFPAT